MNAATAASNIHVKHPRKLFIGGEWVNPSSDATFDIICPIDEEVLMTVAEARHEDMDRAVLAARDAFDNGPWPRMSHAERGEYLIRFAKALHARAEELAHCWTSQVGPTWDMSQHNAASGAGRFDYYASLAGTFEFQQELAPSVGGGRALIVREPVGVVAAIVPWNSPLSLASSKVAPALLAGCTVVLKPSPEAPLECYIMAEIAQEIGLPAGVLNLVTGERDASEHLISNPLVDKVSFTGSSAAGKRIASIVAGRMGRYTMELGGKSAAIVLNDIGTAEAVQSLTGSLSRLSGQICAALSRVIVPRSRHDEFADEFAAAMKQITVGDPYDPATRMGPLAMGRQLERVESYVAKGIEEGATLVTGGRRPADLNRGFYFEPTLFANVDNSMTIAQEEIFGPVISLIPADDDEHAIRIANDSAFGLNGAVMTHDNQRAYDVGRRVRSGNFSQNRFRVDLNVGFGGMKQSGYGREGGADGLMPYLESKTLLLD